MTTSELYERIRFRGRPVAHPEATVARGNVRFTVLTPRLVRMEWSETGAFEDRSTYAFPTRYAETPPAFTVQEAEGVLVIDTGPLLIRYTLGSGAFTPDNLTIAMAADGATLTWRPGTPNPGNLRGTRRTLDRCAGDAPLDPGLLSRDGWALFDDTRNVVFDEDGWVAPRPDFALQDWYFVAYGHDYKGALAAYAQFGGEIPLIPRFVLGGWWSRYWAYSEQDLRDLVAEFETHDVPLDVFVIDMDWHTPDSWTGYTWNRDLFPDPPAFLQWLRDKGLRVTLNLHPAEGVQSFEAVYEQFAQALGVDPKSGDAVPFRIADKTFVEHYFKMLHHPMEDEGVDFWWMDWQQGEISEVKGLDPLPWINHLHFNDIRRRGVRPMLYSRWGGLGNHRYYVGFSGDTYVTWDALQFQPYMTATASNVLYGWWSHDIGGHMGGATEPELYARWVQFGALSPVLRLHSTKDPRAERRPWAYPEAVAKAASDAFRWRYRLAPYLYTMARLTTDTAVALCRPMYYEHPELAGAYAARYQYYLGDQMIAAPIVFPADPETGLASIDVWLPPGTWIAHDTLETLEGPGWVRLVGDLDRIPMLMKAGAILPLAPDFEPQPAPRLASGTTDALPDDRLVLEVFPGDGALRVYQDDGVTDAYRDGDFAWLPVRSWQTNEGHSWVVTVGPVEGACTALPDRQQYEIRLMGCRRPASVLIDGVPAEGWRYDAETLVVVIQTPPQMMSKGVTVTATAGESLVALGTEHNRRVIEADVARLLGAAAPEEMLDIDAVLAVDAPGVADAVARLGGPFFHAIEFVTPHEAGQQLGRVIVGAPDDVPVDVTATFTVARSGEAESRTVTREGVSAGAVLDAPFVYTGEVQHTLWDAEVALAWDGKTITGTYRSEPFFPAIYRWKALVYNHQAMTLDREPALARLAAEASPEEQEGESAPVLEMLVQDPETMRNLNEPFDLRFWDLYRARLRAGEPLAAYLVTTVVSPEARDVVLELHASNPVTFTLNGAALPVVEPELLDVGEYTHFAPPRRTEVVTLKAGENLLVVHTVSPETGRWFFGAKFLTPEGEAVTELAYRR